MKKTLKKFTVEEYYKMAEAGILKEDERVELLRGQIVERGPIGKLHPSCVMRLTNVFSRKLSSEAAIVSVHNPVRLDNHSVPEPDISLLQWKDDFYKSGHPTSSDVLLLIEVAESSLEFDRKEKIPLYGEKGIRETWLVDLAGEVIEVYKDPREGKYGKVEKFHRGDTLSPEWNPQLSLSVGDILG